MLNLLIISKKPRLAQLVFEKEKKIKLVRIEKSNNKFVNRRLNAQITGKFNKH